MRIIGSAGIPSQLAEWRRACAGKVAAAVRLRDQARIVSDDDGDGDGRPPANETAGAGQRCGRLGGMRIVRAPLAACAGRWPARRSTRECSGRRVAASSGR